MKKMDNKKLLIALGQKIRSYREEKKLRQGDLAKLCGVHRNWVCNIENGLMNPSVLLIKKVADVLNVSVDELLKGGLLIIS